MSGQLFHETIANWQDWGNVFQSLSAFTPLSQEICRREHLPWHPLSPLTPGTNGVFRCGEFVLKIFFPKESGLDPTPDFLTETAVCRQIAAWGIPTPALIGEGMIADKYDFFYLVTGFSQGIEAGTWLSKASAAEKEAFVTRLEELLEKIHKPIQGLLPEQDLKSAARNNPRLQKLPPHLAQEIREQVDKLPLTHCVLTHGDLTGENLLVQEDGSLTIIDWADAHLAPSWYELGPIAFELFQGDGHLWKLFAGKNQEAFLEGLLDCVCVHDFGADFLIQLAQRENLPPFQNLQEVRKLAEQKLR